MKLAFPRPFSTSPLGRTCARQTESESEATLDSGMCLGLFLIATSRNRRQSEVYGLPYCGQASGMPRQMLAAAPSRRPQPGQREAMLTDHAHGSTA
jgi:hypothetical protein